MTVIPQVRPQHGRLPVPERAEADDDRAQGAVDGELVEPADRRRGRGQGRETDFQRGTRGVSRCSKRWDGGGFIYYVWKRENRRPFTTILKGTRGSALRTNRTILFIFNV